MMSSSPQVCYGMLIHQATAANAHQWLRAVQLQAGRSETIKVTHTPLQTDQVGSDQHDMSHIITKLCIAHSRRGVSRNICSGFM